MARGIIEKEYGFILKDDKSLPSEEQTTWYIKPKTVRKANETAARYATVSKTDRKSGEQKYDVGAMNRVDDEEWLTAVKRVENYFMPDGVPGGGDTECLRMLGGAEENDSIKRATIMVESAGAEEEVKGYMIIKTSDPELLKRISWSMSPSQHEEIMEAYYNYSILTEATKNS